MANELVTRLREILNPGGEPLAYLLDGSSLELEASPSLRKLYPPAENQQGRAHWPVLRILVLYELETGLAEQPQWGPMYGAAAVSEQALAERAMMRSRPVRCWWGIAISGCFRLPGRRSLGVVVRLTEARARKLAGGPIGEEGERAVSWAASRFDGRRQGGMPEGACVAGRWIAARIGRGKSKAWLYLFTTVAPPREPLLAPYAKRWRIETDLRSLKRTIGLHHVAARNESTMEKQLLTAVAAYNLVRAVIALAARRHRLSPRQLSFTFVLNVVHARWDATTRVWSAAGSELTLGAVPQPTDMVAAPPASAAAPEISARRLTDLPVTLPLFMLPISPFPSHAHRRNSGLSN
ncbi:MAG: transposase [Bryobacteraceae bacterium]